MALQETVQSFELTNIPAHIMKELILEKASELPFFNDGEVLYGIRSKVNGVKYRDVFTNQGYDNSSILALCSTGSLCPVGFDFAEAIGTIRTKKGY